MITKRSKEIRVTQTIFNDDKTIIIVTFVGDITPESPLGNCRMDKQDEDLYTQNESDIKQEYVDFKAYIDTLVNKESQED